MCNRKPLISALLGLALITAAPLQAETDDKPADMAQPVKVFILLGQSNMVGAGTVKSGKEGSLEDAVKKEKLYPFLVNTEGNWSERQDVRYVRYMTGKLLVNSWMNVLAVCRT